MLPSRAFDATSYLPMILFTVTTNAAAQLLLKTGMMNFSAESAAAGEPRNIALVALAVLFNPFVFFGLVTMVVSMASHLYVLSRVDVSFAFPFLSIAYVLVALYAWQFMGEDLGVSRILGIGLICLGTFFIART